MADSGEYIVLDRMKWREIPDKHVRKSGDVYLGQQYIGKEIRIFIMDEKQ